MNDKSRLPKDGPSQRLSVAYGLIFGAALGLLVGIVFELNLALGIAFGAGLGLVVGIVADGLRRQ
ncbi:MAG TPA: hypothetical protein PK593_02565 [Thermomicrobiales bacterium]|nr:hypothetical protein [Chloroflexota bacterium]HQX62322.1 hypothetical protein [Thermomicrobiales bacterium]HQZ90289.1 hypothetical protein [Thermomicrobiales bacterium]HRA31053.1 hypothetical protein [Thermomicrobiales bacterium]